MKTSLRAGFVVVAACLPSAALAQSLSTPFNSNNQFAGNTFDLAATNPVTIVGFDVNLDNPGSVNQVSVFAKTGTCVGFENNAAAWTIMGKDVSVNSAGLNNHSPVNVLGLYLRPGLVYGTYVDLTSYVSGGTVLRYTNGAAGTVFSNADLAFTSNSGQPDPAFSAPIAGRIWNGTVKYKPTAIITPLQTTLAGGNSFAGNTFDLVAKDFITLTGFDMNITAPAGAAETVTVYIRSGSAVGHEGSGSGWFLLGQDTNAVVPASGPTHVNVGGLSMIPGQVFGVYLDLASYVLNTHYVNYTNGAAGTVFQDQNLRLVSNSGQGSPAFTGGVFAGRIVNGAVTYVRTPVDAALQTTLANNNAFAGNTFDVFANRNITLDGFDVNLSALNSLNNVTIYWRNGTATGHETSAAGWNVLGNDAAVVSNGPGLPTPVHVGGLRMQAAQTYGIYVDVTSYPSSSMQYTNGAAGTAFSDGVLTVRSNSGQVNPAFSGTIAGRIWNGRIYYHETYCYANCDGSLAAPVLNVADFTCFLQKYAAGDPYANCDGSVLSPVLNVADFTCFLQSYAAGCP